MRKTEKLVAVYRARNTMEAQVIKGLLESFAVPCVLKSNAASSVHFFTVDGMAETEVMVPEALAEVARGLIQG
ncbi:MAG: DUF2007 domain-containing protein [Dehalococcoidales bacterium]|nr:DUF2007 domain-containing protein [Dehalococcoidales bacterium]